MGQEITTSGDPLQGIKEFVKSGEMQPEGDV